MPEMLLINPRRKTHRRRKMTAKQAMYFGKRRRTHRRRAPVTALATNPRRRRRILRRNPRTALARNPRRVRRMHRNPIRRMRRNPIGGSFSLREFTNNTIIPGAIGAVGAVALDVVMGYLTPMLPTSLTSTPIASAVTRIAGAVGIGYAAAAIAGERRGEEAAAGAVVVTLYGIVRSWFASAMPSVPLGMYRRGGMGYAGAARHFNDLGVYVAGGAALPAPVARAIAASKTVAPSVGMHGAFSEGEYSYGG